MSFSTRPQAKRYNEVESQLLVQPFGQERHNFMRSKGFPLIRLRNDVAKECGFKIQKDLYFVDVYDVKTMSIFAKFFGKEGFRLSKLIEINTAEYPV